MTKHDRQLRVRGWASLMVYYNHIAKLWFITLHIMENVGTYTLCLFHTRFLDYLLTRVTASVANFCYSALKL